MNDEEREAAAVEARRLAREGLQAAVERMNGAFDVGDDMPQDGMVTTWVAVIEVSRPGGGFHWLLSGDATDDVAFLARAEGLLMYGMRRVGMEWERAL